MSSEWPQAGGRRTQFKGCLQRLSHGQGVYCEDLIDLLEGELDELRQLWTVNLNNGLEVARRTVSAHLYAYIMRLRPVGRRRDMGEVELEKYRTDIATCFNISTGPELRRMDLKRRQERLAVQNEVSARTIRRDFADVIDQIADMLMEDVRQSETTDEQNRTEAGSSSGDPPHRGSPTPSDSVNMAVHDRPVRLNERHPCENISQSASTVSPLPIHRLSRSNRLYVHREKEEARFHKLVKQGAPVIAVVGQAGMGKTWLATHLANGLCIRFSEGMPNRSDVAAALIHCRISDSAVTDPVASLVALLCDPEKAPASIVLDNLDSLDELKTLLPANGISTPLIVATSRRRGQRIPPDWSIIPIRGMTQTQATRMVRIRLPELSQEETATLADAFDYYPLVLDHVCSLYQTGHDSSVSEFSESLKSDVKRLAQHTYTENGGVLRFILQTTLQRLRDHDSLAYDLFRFICFYWEPTETGAMSEVEEYASIMGFGGIGQVAQALDLLEQFSLVAVEITEPSPGGHYPPNLKPCVTMHPLVRQIMCEEFDEEKSLVAAGFLRAYQRLLLQPEVAARSRCYKWIVLRARKWAEHSEPASRSEWAFHHAVMQERGCGHGVIYFRIDKATRSLSPQLGYDGVFDSFMDLCLYERSLLERVPDKSLFDVSFDTSWWCVNLMLSPRYILLGFISDICQRVIEASARPSAS